MATGTLLLSSVRQVDLKFTSALVAETVAALRELAIHNSVRLVWVPGHYSVPGNEVADVLAKQASAQPYIGP